MVAIYAVVIIVGLYRIFAIVQNSEEGAVYEVTTRCYQKYWYQLTFQNFIYLLPILAQRCAPSFHAMGVYHFGDEGEWRYSMIPEVNVGCLVAPSHIRHLQNIWA
ncbi:unnamed protein product [Strongylus vulgaris]|uniref:Uncharacterized protein n=1 Tax=Strongylus vulgaris TaxID=40348 RepID=A0A3P7JRK7_STRVU|nr:unnamed protein product [Strongylus vulgaris]